MDQEFFDKLYNKWMVMYFKYGYSYQEAHEKTIANLKESLNETFDSKEEQEAFDNLGYSEERA